MKSIGRRLDKLETADGSQNKRSLMASYLCKHWLGVKHTKAEAQMYERIESGEETFEMSDFSDDFREWIEPRCSQEVSHA